MNAVREYVKVRYRISKPRIFHNPYDLNGARIRLMHMRELADFQLNLIKGGHAILGVTRISREEYIRLKVRMKERKLKREEQLQEA